MFGCPLTIRDFRLVNRLKVAPFDLDRDSEPDRATCSFDLIAVPPISLGVLHAIQQHDLVGRAEHVEIAAPRDVVGLSYDRGLRHVCGTTTKDIWISYRLVKVAVISRPSSIL